MVVLVGHLKLIRLDYLLEYFVKVIPTYFLELIAALSGSYFLLKRENSNLIDKYLVYFLWITLIVDIFGSYAAIAYFTEYKYLGFIKDTVFRDNRWIYNIYTLLFYVFYCKYFINHSNDLKIKKILNVITIIFLFSAVLNLIFSDVIFDKASNFNSIWGTIISILCIALFYFDLLKSDKVLKLKYYLPIYISIGVLVFNLLVTPIDVFSAYFNKENNNYFKLKGTVLLGVNIVMYGLFTMGFLVCARKENNKIYNN